MQILSSEKEKREKESVLEAVIEARSDVGNSKGNLSNDANKRKSWN